MTTVVLRRPPRALAAPAVARLAPAAVLAVGLALRLTELGRVPPDPFYDAAVRSMGTSWHDFLFGALEPGGSVAIDKPPLALWLQVASTRLLGFTTPALLTPEALAGTAAVWLLYLLVRDLWGRIAGLASAAALAVLPLAVVTARSDTMDALATTLALLPALLLVRAARADEGAARSRAPAARAGEGAARSRPPAARAEEGAARSRPPAARAEEGAARSRAPAARAGDGAARWLMAAAGAAIGLAFNVKLFQALVPVPAVAVLYFAASSLPAAERLSRLVLTAAVAAAVGIAWLAVVSTAPGRDQPWALGSGNGSALSAAFGYNGIDRLRGNTRAAPPSLRLGADRRRVAPPPVRGRLAAAAARRPDPPGPLRLAGRGGDLRGLLGVELVPAVLIAALALAAAGAGALWRRIWRRGVRAPASAAIAVGARAGARLARAGAAGAAVPSGGRAGARLVRAGAAGCAVWLLTGLALFSWLPGLQVRYLDELAPAVAAVLGGGIVAIARAVRAPAWATVAAVAALLAVPAANAVGAVRAGDSDSGHIGTMRPGELERLSAFLAARTAGQRYELASADTVKATPLIARDARPVLMLDTLAGRPLTPLRRLLGAVRRGEVTYVLMTDRCGPRSAAAPDGCGAVGRWARVHGRDVSRRAGVPRHTLYALGRVNARRALYRIDRDRRIHRRLTHRPRSSIGPVHRRLTDRAASSPRRR